MISALQSRHLLTLPYNRGSRMLSKGTICRDLYVGAVLDIHSRNFELVEADEFTLQYMESNRVLYPQADWQNAAGLIRDYTQGQPSGPVLGSCDGLASGHDENAMRANRVCMKLCHG